MYDMKKLIFYFLLIVLINNIQAQSTITIQTISDLEIWTPHKISNSGGATLHWEAIGNGITPQIQDVNLPTFDFSDNVNNELITITITSSDNFIAFTELDIRGKEVIALNVANATELTLLQAYTNNLTSLDVSQNTKLKIVRVMVNSISSLNINNLTELTHIIAFSNNFSSLNLSDNTQLVSLNVKNTNMSSVDISNNKLLTLFDLRDSNFTDVSLDQLLIDIDNNNLSNPNVPVDGPPNIRLSGNPGNLTSASYAAYMSLKSKGWTFDVAAPGPDIDVQGGNALISIIGDGTNVIKAEDGTDFGTAVPSTSKTHSFTIENNGTQNLDITTISVANTNEYSISGFTSGTINPGSSVIFDITFTPVVESQYDTTIDIVSNEGNSPFHFNITGEGKAGSPKIEAFGNGVLIVNGDTTPDTADDTDFGQVANNTTKTVTYTIYNTGNVDLNISDIAMGGWEPAPEFTVTSISQALPYDIIPGGNMTFDVSFAPISTSTYTSYVEITSSDSGANPYRYSIKGESISTSSGTIDVQGNGISIANGDIDPDVADDTDFEQVTNNTPKTNTFTIENTGTTDLTIASITFNTGFSPEFSFGNLPTSNTVIPVGGQPITFDVVFTPTADGIYDAIVNIENSDDSPFEFKVQGEGIPTPPVQDIMITQYYSGISSPDKWIEVKNISGSVISAGTYYLALFDNTVARTGVIESSEPTKNTAVPALLPGQVVLFKNGSASLPSSGNIGTADQVISDVCIFENGDDVILISTKNDVDCYNNRVDIIGNVSPSSNQDPNVWGDNSSFIKGGCSSEQAHINFDINDWTFLNLPGVNVADPNTNIALGTQVVGPTEFDGTNWSNKHSDQSRTVIITNSFTNASQTIEACNLIISQGVNIVFDSNGVTNNSIVVYGDFTNSGSLTIGDKESFVTIKDNAVLGTITKIDKTTPLNNYHDVTYWSSPVQSQQLFTVFAGVDPDRIFYYRGGDENPIYEGTIYKYWYKAVSGAMEAGRGYTSEALTSTPNGGAYTVTFTGIPFNGTITKGGLWYSGTPDTGNANENFNLMGNPYPTAIDIRKFFSANGDISDIALWNHDTPVDSNGNYVPADYLFYNSSGSSSPGVTFNIGSGQGFMARTIGLSGAVFKNTFKIKDANNQFYKIERSKKGYLLVDGDKDRIWLRLTSKSIGTKDDILIAFNKESTDDLDPRYDTYGGLGEKKIHLYSLIPGKDSKFVIQGLGDFDQSKTISVGFDSKNSGSLSVGIAGLEGKLKGEEVYLVDHLLNITHDLKASDYQFEQTATGSFPDRFTLQFAGQALDVDDEIFARNEFVISSDLDSFKIRSAKEVKEIRVYDLLGRMIIQKQPNKKSFNINTTNIKNGTVLVIKATLENGSVISKKTIKY